MKVVILYARSSFRSAALQVRYTTGMRALSLLCAVVICALLPSALYAARLYVDVGAATHSRLDTFYVPIRLDVEGECINAAEVTVTYDSSDITVLDVARGQSIFTLWTQEPIIDATRGTIHFEGGIPGGYCGRVEGDPGQTNMLAQLVVTGATKPLAAGERTSSTIAVNDTTRLYLHDGLGSELTPDFGAGLVTLVVATTTPENTWLGDVRADRVAPELFDITLTRDPSVADNKWFVVFGTVDKQTGVDHFEVLETDPDRFGFLTWLPRESHWVVARSPYVLRDQALSSKIMVKAIDKNGNERVVTYTPPMSPLQVVVRYKTLFMVTVLLLLAIGALVLFARRRLRHRNESIGMNLNHDTQNQ